VYTSCQAELDGALETARTMASKSSAELDAARVEIDALQTKAAELE